MSNELEVQAPETELTPEIVKKYICPRATEQEIYFFIQLCKAQSLNPFLKEAYLVKYGDQPAAIVAGKESFTKRADEHPAYNGFKAGIIAQSKVHGGAVCREGSFYLPNEEVWGGWAEVYRKDRSTSFRVEVALSEYIQRRGDGTPNKFWAEKPGTMIRKVAIVQALREAFPEKFAGLYVAEEMQMATEELPIYEMGKEPKGGGARLEPPKSKSEVVVEATVVSGPDANTETETVSMQDASKEKPQGEGQTHTSQETEPIWDLKKVSEVLSSSQSLSALHNTWKPLTPHIAKLDKDGKVECQKLKNAVMEILRG